jgi:SET domain-containing protein
MSLSVLDSTSAPVTATTENILVRQSVIHGTGVFARRQLTKGSHVIEYVGEKIAKDESARRIDADNEFIFTLDDEFDLDGKVAWNPARFINHSCTPNCEAEVDGHSVWIIALRDIPAGEELSFNYGYDLSDFHEHPCRCGAAQCVGFMVAEEHFDHVRQTPGVASNGERATT